MSRTVRRSGRTGIPFSWTHFTRQRNFTITVSPARYARLPRGTILFPPKKRTASFLSEKQRRKEIERKKGKKNKKEEPRTRCSRVLGVRSVRCHRLSHILKRSTAVEICGSVFLCKERGRMTMGRKPHYHVPRLRAFQEFKNIRGGRCTYSSMIERLANLF